MSDKGAQQRVSVDSLIDAAIGRFRSKLPDSEWKLKHDCLVATGMRRSPHRGGKLEARQRVVDAINAEMVKAMEAMGNDGSEGTTCQCGHAVEEHGNDPEHPGSTACGECPEGDCIAYESAP